MGTPADMMQLPPGTDPADFAKAMRQRQIAEALQNMAMEPTQLQQPPSGVHGTYQMARVGPASTLARLAAGLMSKKATDNANTGMAQMYARGLQSFDPNSPGGQAPSPQAAPMPSGAAPPPPVQQPQMQAPQTIGGSSAVNPMNPLHQDPRALMRLYMTDPAKYLDQIKGTPEWQTTLATYGGNVTAAQHALQAKLLKESAISNRAGEENMIFDGTNADGSPRYRYIRTPNLSPNQDYSRNATGGIAETHLIPGAATAQQTLQRAEALGKNQGELHAIPNAGGGTHMQVGLEGIPGAPKSYFPGMGASPAPQAPAAGAPAMPMPGAAPSPTPAGVTPGIWRGAPIRPSGQGGSGEDPYLKGQIEGMVKKNDELSDKYGSESDLADQRIAFNNEALKVLNGAQTGPLSEQITALSAKAHELGLNLPWLPDEATVNNTAELKKFLLRNPLLSLKPTFGGRPAASEFQILANDASPSPQMLHGAISRLVQLDNQAAGFSKQRSTDYGYFHDQLQGNPQRFENWYSNRVPFARWLNEHPAGRAGESRVSPDMPALPDLQAEMARRGLKATP